MYLNNVYILSYSLIDITIYLDLYFNHINKLI